jgi:glutathione S-transferase
MIELIQIPWSPFCLVQKRILEFGRIPFKPVNIPNHDRALVWKLTRERYYGVPIIRDGKTVVFETDDDSQIIAKYLDAKFDLGLFPHFWTGTETIIWRHIENEIEGVCFKLNDIYYKEFVPRSDQLPFLRHKERKFGRGCIDQWRAQTPQLLDQLAHYLNPFEVMLEDRPFLLDHSPHFVDFDLYGMLANFLFTGHYKLPAIHTRLNEWFPRIAKLKISETLTCTSDRSNPNQVSEKLHPRHQRFAARPKLAQQLRRQ